MESYEEFCVRSLARLQAEGQTMRTACASHRSQDPLSIIRFYGRTVLPPLLSEEQRREMTEHKQRAVQLEVDRQTLQRSNLLTRVQNILDHVQLHKVPDVEIEKLTPPYRPPPKPGLVNGYTLVTDSPELPRGDRMTADVREKPTTPRSEPPLCFSGYRGEIEVEERKQVEVRREVKKEEQDGSLQSLLRRSREYVVKEQEWRVSKSTSSMIQTPPPPCPPLPLESLSDKENEGRSPLEIFSHTYIRVILVLVVLHCIVNVHRHYA